VERKGNNDENAVFDPAQIFGIDHGICFHEEYKLRTVIWEFAGEPIPLKLLTNLQSFQHNLQNPGSELNSLLATLLNKNEIMTLVQRVERLIIECVFPEPGLGRHYPWPPV
jgi:uncharacterized repeat protein (TIGR03843 family)